MRTTTIILVQILAFVGGLTVSSIFITKSETWKISLPIFLSTSLIMIVDIVLTKKKNK
jgi:hypothetical protein